MAYIFIGPLSYDHFYSQRRREETNDRKELRGFWGLSPSSPFSSGLLELEEKNNSLIGGENKTKQRKTKPLP